MAYLKELKINKRKVTKVKAGNWLFFYIGSRLKAKLFFSLKYRYFIVSLFTCNNKKIFFKQYWEYKEKKHLKALYKEAINKIYDYLKECKY